MELEKFVENYKDDIIKSLREIVQIKSVEDVPKPGMPFGEGVNRALEYALNLSENLGFRTENFDGYAGHAEFGDGDKTVGILVHLDVVPEGKGWTYPPYGAEIHDEKIFGRGTIDDKGPAIAALYAMKALKESKMSLRSKIRIIFGTNEESGWGGIDYYLKKAKAPDIAFTPDADFPIIHGEKGILDIMLKKQFSNMGGGDIIVKTIKGGDRTNMVPDLCTAILEIKNKNIDYIKNIFEQFVNTTNFKMSIKYSENNIIEIVSEGVSAHGSTPEVGKNAISQLLLFLGKLVGDESDISKFIKLYNDKINIEYNGQSIGCGFEDDISGKLSFNVGIIDMNEKEVTLKINIRYPLKISKEDVLNGIKEELKETGIEVVELDHLAPIFIPEEDFLVQKLLKVYREITGDNKSKPIVIGGGTYARAMKNAVAFGPLFPGQEELAHQKDEYISIEHLLKITKIYTKALYELAK